MREQIICIFAVYLAVVSLIAAVMTVLDKSSARRDAWRVSESSLLIISALGGSLVMYITMHLIRHKTKHVKFMIGIPIIILFQAIAIAYLFTRVL